MGLEKDLKNKLEGKLFYDVDGLTESVINAQKVITQNKFGQTDVIIYGKVLTCKIDSESVSVKASKRYVVRIDCVKELQEIGEEQFGRYVNKFLNNLNKALI